MGLPALLIVLLALHAAFPGQAPAADAPRCLKCHVPHYVDLGGCTGCHGGNDRIGRLPAAHYSLVPGAYARHRLPKSPSVDRGKKLIDRYGCRRCHVLAGRGNRLASDLDRSSLLSVPRRTADAIRTPAFHMPDFRFTEGGIADLVNALLAGARGAKPTGKEKEIPDVVHFRPVGRPPDDPFTKRCGPCHKALTAEHGGLGGGVSGPNLSALFSVEFPRRNPRGNRWTPAALKRWVENPWKDAPGALMPPALVKEEEFEGIVRILSVLPPRSAYGHDDPMDPLK